MYKGAVTVKQMQALDKRAIDKIGIPSIALMENAGSAVAGEVIKKLKNKKAPTVCIFCGLGNNAGDGFVIARHLTIAGVKVKIYLVGQGSQLKSDALINYQSAKKLKLGIKEIKNINPEVIKNMKQADIVVDALFGTGLSREVRDPFKSVIGAINQYSKHTISVDIPSGLNGTTGQIFGACIKAKQTVTFVRPKTGFYKNKGPKNTGRIKVADIGIPHGK